MSDTADIAQLTERLIAFRDARDWRQFHSLKDLIVSLNLEAGELLELTQWQKEEDFEAASATPDTKARLGEECADAFLYLLLICERTGIDLLKAAADKIAQNEAKYPIEKSRGRATKYTKL
jgi:NTP pyrophosphatase (non-canonical NTP hydrolase)